MEKRFLLALLLTALVVVATPLLFPPPPERRSAAGDQRPETTAAPRPREDAAERGSLAERDSVAAAPRAVTPAPPPVDTADATPAADTITVETAKAIYHLTTEGAAPLSVVMREFPSLRSDTGRVVLTSGAAPLLRYRVVTQRDTLRLDRGIFAATRAGDAARDPQVTFMAPLAQGEARITYTFAPDSYLVRVRGTVEGLSEPAFLLVDLPETLQSAEADTIADRQSLAYSFMRTGDDAGRISFDDLDPGERRLEPGPLTWVAVKSKYFLVALLAEPSGPPFGELTVVGGPRTTKAATTAHGTAVIALEDGGFRFEMYTGPQELRRLLALGRDFENVNPYGGFLQVVIQPFATIVMQVLLWMKETLEVNYGWILIIFGIVVRLILWPLNQRAMRSSLQMQRLQPQLAEIQKRHSRDPEKYREEIMKVYKEHGMSPLSPVMGCLPMLLPMPVLIALFFVFQNTIEFRGVSFLWLPDISLKDPYYIVPILMGLSMFLLSWIGLRGSPPNPQAKVMGYVFPVMMTVLFLNFASGLNLYYFVQNLAALPQQWLIARQRAKVRPALATT